MSGYGAGDYFETGNTNLTEISVKSCIMTMIEDLERDLERIEGKIAAICGGEKQGEIKDRTRGLVEDKKRTDNETVVAEASGEADTDVSGLKPVSTVDIAVIEETEEDMASNGDDTDNERSLDEEGGSLDTISQHSDAETDEDEWAAFISERSAIPAHESNIDLAAPEPRADSSDDADDDWEDFCRERATMTVVDESNDTGDNWDDFFSERAPVDKYTKQTKSKVGRLRRLVRRIFGRH